MSENAAQSRIASSQRAESATLYRQRESIRESHLARGDEFHRAKLFGKAVEEFEAAFAIRPTATYQQIQHAMCAGLAPGNPMAAEHIGSMFLPGLQWHDDSGQYVAVYQALALIAQGKKTAAKVLVAEAVYKLQVGRWPYPIVLFLNDELTAGQLGEQAEGSRSNKTEAFTAIGWKALYSDSSEEAESYLEWVVKKGSKDEFEYDIAAAAYEKAKSIGAQPSKRSHELVSIVSSKRTYEGEASYRRKHPFVIRFTNFEVNSGAFSGEMWWKDRDYVNSFRGRVQGSLLKFTEVERIKGSGDLGVSYTMRYDRTSHRVAGTVEDGNDDGSAWFTVDAQPPH